MSETWLKYALPAVLLASVGYAVQSVANAYSQAWGLGCAGIFYLTAFLFGLQAAQNFIMEWRDQNSIIYQAKRRADNETSDVQLAKHLTQLHPAAADILRGHGLAGWSVIPGKEPDQLPDHIVYGTHITIEFMRDFLLSSNDEYVCPMQKFSNDGAKLYAPELIGKESWVEDREQYREACALLVSLGRLTPAYSNQPHAWRKPWNPARCAATFGIELEPTA